MAAIKKKQKTDGNTEQSIKAAAKVVFHKKGYAATRTRDIAEVAGMNLALLNYYFRSKEKLFQLIMVEAISEFMQNLDGVFNDPKTTFERKLELVSENYIDLFIKEPEMPLFIMSELRMHGAEILNKMPAAEKIMQSVFIKQYKVYVKKTKAADPDPVLFIMNLMALIVFPFIGSPILKRVGNISDKQFDLLMQKRKKLIPVWVKVMLNSH